MAEHEAGGRIEAFFVCERHIQSRSRCTGLNFLPEARAENMKVFGCRFSKNTKSLAPRQSLSTAHNIVQRFRNTILIPPSRASGDAYFS